MSITTIYSWTDVYSALVARFGNARGWATDTSGSERGRYPLTLNADAIVVAAVLNPVLDDAPPGFGAARVLALWDGVLDDLDRHALPPAERGQLYPRAREFWAAIREVCLYLDQSNEPTPPSMVWAALEAHLEREQPDRAGSRNGYRNNYKTDIKVTEGPDGHVTFEGAKDFIDLYLAQWNYYVTKRGADLDRNKQQIPRTTNIDVLQLATYWQGRLDDDGHPNRPGVMNDKSNRAEWAAAVAHVQADATGKDPNAVYSHNDEFWNAVDDISSQLQSEGDAPTRAELLEHAAYKAIADLPKNVGKGLKWIAGETEDIVSGVANAAGQAAKEAADGLFGELKWPLLIGGGALGVYLLTRNREHGHAEAA